MLCLQCIVDFHTGPGYNRYTDAPESVVQVPRYILYRRGVQEGVCVQTHNIVIILSTILQLQVQLNL